MTSAGCLDCDDTSWFESWDGKEYQPQPDGTYVIIMRAGPKTASRRVAGSHEFEKYDHEMCRELGIKHFDDL